MGGWWWWWCLFVVPKQRVLLKCVWKLAVVFDDAKMVPFSLLLNPKRIKTLNIRDDFSSFFLKGRKEL